MIKKVCWQWSGCYVINCHRSEKYCSNGNDSEDYGVDGDSIENLFFKVLKRNAILRDGTKARGHLADRKRR